MKTAHNGTRIDGLRAHRIYDMLAATLDVDPEERAGFVAAAGRGDPTVDLKSAGIAFAVFINQHGIWAVGADPELCTISGMEELYAVTARLKEFLLAHYISGAPGPEFDAEIQKAHGVENEKDKSAAG